jgi:GNAT superfamily N-acetyltransferase
MDITYGRMREGQEDQVADLIFGLIADYGTTFKSVLTPDSLKQSADFLNIEVAERDCRVVGICAWMMSFSTWRGSKGMYVADHFVTKELRHTEVARDLLRLAAENGAKQGANFIRMEVDITDDVSEALYTEAGFWHQTRHMLYFLEPAEFGTFVAT